MENIKILQSQIECDLHNIQTLIDMLPSSTKGEYRIIASNIKKLVKEIRSQKVMIAEELFEVPPSVRIKLFEVDPSPTEMKDVEKYEEIDSYLGNIS